MAKITSLPKEIETRLDNNYMFNKFGIVNLKVLRLDWKTELTDEEIKDLINKRFAKEMVGETIEFI